MTDPIAPKLIFLTSVYSTLELLNQLNADSTSPAAPGFKVTATNTGFGTCQAFKFLAAIKGGVGGTLDIIVEHSPDGIDWYEMIHFPQLAAGAPVIRYDLPRYLSSDGGIIPVGKNLTTTTILPVNTAVNPPYFDQFRVRYIAGAGTTAGSIRQSIIIVGYRPPITLPSY